MTVSIRGAARAVHDPSVPARLRGIAAGALLALLALGQPLLAHEYKAGSLEIDHPWSRATPPGARVAAGYLVIRNAGSVPDRLVSVTGEIAGRAEIHEMAVGADGIMTMRPVDGVEIPAGGAAELKPGGYHVMFMELTSGPKEGERFKGSLTFEKAGTVEVEFSVEAMGGRQGQDAGHGAGHDGHGG